MTKTIPWTAEDFSVCAECGTEWEEEAGANEFGCWVCGGMKSVTVGSTELAKISNKYYRTQQ